MRNAGSACVKEIGIPYRATYATLPYAKLVQKSLRRLNAILPISKCARHGDKSPLPARASRAGQGHRDIWKLAGTLCRAVMIAKRRLRADIDVKSPPVIKPHVQCVLKYPIEIKQS